MTKKNSDLNIERARPNIEGTQFRNREIIEVNIDAERPLIQARLDVTRARLAFNSAAAGATKLGLAGRAPQGARGVAAGPTTTPGA